MSSTPASLSSHIGYWLRAVSNHVSHAFARRIADEGVTVAEWVVLRSLFDSDDIGPAELADRLRLTRGAITRLADRLIAKALLRRTQDPADGRAQRLTLTERGHALVPRLAALADANEAEMFAPLTADEQAQLTGLLSKLVNAHALHSAPID